MEEICCYCGKLIESWFHGQGWLCETCSAWKISRKEIAPTISEALSEQYHRIGKDGGKYWGRLGAGIVFTDGKQVLLLKRDPDSDYAGHWSIPGGKAKEGEAPIDVATRESREECGTSEGSRFAQFDAKDGAHHFHTFLYAVPRPFEPRISKEHTDAKWVPLDEVLDLKLHPKFKEAWPGHLRAIEKRFPKKTTFGEYFSSRESN